MAGIHTAYRQTNYYNFVAVSSELTLPTVYGCRENDYNSKNGAFPEFFHGFYDSHNYGLDIGVIYKGGRFRLAFWSYHNTQPTQWFTSSGFRVPSNRRVILSSYFKNGYLVTRCKDTHGKVLACLDVKLTTKAYNVLSNGCYINREMVIAMNKNSDGKFEVPASAYFKNSKFSRTTLTNSHGQYIALTKYNSNTRKTGKVDPATPNKTYDYDISLNIMEHGYVTDIASATMDKYNHALEDL
jgi:hypothetical protein